MKLQCGERVLRASGGGIAWELARNADSQPPQRSAESKSGF